MGEVRTFDTPSYVDSLGEITARVVRRSRSLGDTAFQGLRNSVSGFEAYMTARSLPEGHRRDVGMSALESIDPSFARKLEERFERT
jgi:hypothetical protein